MMKRVSILAAVFFLIMTFSASQAPGAERGSACTRDDECDDGVYCNGSERCVFLGFGLARTGVCAAAAAPVICNDGIDCTTDTCSEAARTCRHTPPDIDGDGHWDAECLDLYDEPLGDDCDDEDDSTYPGNPEVCDSDDHDEDCNIETFGNRDADGDGHVDFQCCNVDSRAGGYAYCGSDCDDTKAGVHPGVPEVCNYIDDDCDVAIDEGVAQYLYPDADRDGHGYGDFATETVFYGCVGAVGYSTLNNDCDDTNPAIQPGAMICNPGPQGRDPIPGITPPDILICGSDGIYLSGGLCAPGTCISQPNGTGFCHP